MSKSDKQRIQEKLQKIDHNKNLNGTRKVKKLKKYSNKFNEMFEFYYKIYRTGLITFCGSNVDVDFDINGGDCKYTFREYDNGCFKHFNPISKHPNILKSVIIGKKGWGLWVKLYSEGIGEGVFTKYEILNEFKIRDIEIPKSMMVEFENAIWLERIKYCEKNP